jgi:hypothetical protein
LAITNTYTRTSTPVSTPVNTSTTSPTATHSPVVNLGGGDVDKVYPVPNPVFASGTLPSVYYHCTGKVDTVVIKVYTKAMTCMLSQEFTDTLRQSGWAHVQVPALSALKSGTYFVTAGRKGQKKPATQTLVVLK